MLFTLSSLDHTAHFGATLAEAMLQVPELKVILFTGDLGSGKTTMTRAFVHALPCRQGEEAEVSSPSFTLCNLYPTQPEVAHFDLYRLEAGPADDALLDAFDDGTSIVLVEWAERLQASEVPPVHLHLCWQRQMDMGETRLLNATAHGDAAQKVLALVGQNF
ncbi:MAG: tRNA (adenosine(37)-N6)-threonylcarbamoyltransferase complex ATPase subunit type 1 TsaE [Pseudomonadota bacterium]